MPALLARFETETELEKNMEIGIIDELAQLDARVKADTARCKELKEQIANQYGEGKFRGAIFGVRVTIEPRKGAVDIEELCKAYGITDEQLNKFRAKTLAVIKVCPTA